MLELYSLHNFAFCKHDCALLSQTFYVYCSSTFRSPKKFIGLKLCLQCLMSKLTMNGTMDLFQTTWVGGIWGKIPFYSYILVKWFYSTPICYEICSPLKKLHIISRDAQVWVFLLFFNPTTHEGIDIRPDRSLCKPC